MHLKFEARLKGDLRPTPCSSPAAILTTYGSLRVQKVFLARSWSRVTFLSVSTAVWKNIKFRSPRLWVVSLNNTRKNSESQTFLSTGKEGRRGGGEQFSSLEQQFRLCQAAKEEVVQAVVGFLLGLAILLTSADLGLADEIPSVHNSRSPYGESISDEKPQYVSNHSCGEAPALDNVGGGVERVSGMPHLKYLMGIPTVNARARKKGSISCQSGLTSQLLVSARKEILHESIAESSGMTYGQILQGRNDLGNRESMYTEDAWVGMLNLRQYEELLAKVEPEEKLCPECTTNRRLLERVWQTVSNEYYDQYGSFSQSDWAGKLYESLSATGGLLRTEKETYKVLKKMVESLGDRYSAFLDPQQYRLAIRRPIPSEIKYLTYQYTGVGVVLGKKSPIGGLTIVAPFAGSPAEEAGILSGERLLRIDGIPVDSLSPEEAGNRLRGPVGSIVELEVSGLQPGNSVRELVLERRSLPLPPLRTRLVDARDGRVLEYIRLHYFTHEGTKSMAAAIRDGEALGVDGYILDLRNNPGGVFEEAIAMAALWLDCQGCDVAETVRSSVGVEDLVYSVNNLPKEIFFRHPGTLTHAPLAIITNRSSASASEVLTGALHDNHRAVIVGEKTFGKGVVQYFFPMDDGSGLKLTVEKYLTPARYDISKNGGLEPDRSCEDFPHQSGQSDSCIDEAIEMLGDKQRPSLERLPYRWIPLSESWFLANGTY